MPTAGGLPPGVVAFWRRFLAARPEARDRGLYDASRFGDDDDAATADECAALVVARVKTATSGLLWWYEEEGLPLPEPGALHVVLTSSGELAERAAFLRRAAEARWPGAIVGAGRGRNRAATPDPLILLA